MGMFRANLSRRNPKEASRILIAEMRNIVKSDPVLALHLFGDEIKSYFKGLKKKSDIFPLYSEIMRASSGSADLAYDKIAEPLIEMFVEELDDEGAKKAFAIFESSTRSNPISEQKLESEKSALLQKCADIRKQRAEEAAWAELDKENDG